MADSAVPMLLFLGFLFVSLTLILGLGLMSREEERAEEERERASRAEAEAAAHASEPIPQPVVATAPSRVAAYAAADAEDAGQDSVGPSSVDELVAQLEEYLRNEFRQVAAFVARPSPRRLFGDRSPTPVRRLGSEAQQ